MAQEKISCKSDHASKVLDSFDRMRIEEFGCDFTIEVCGQHFRVHRTILSACSDYFKAMFSHPTKESNEGVVNMKDVKPDAVKKCIDFMYKGETNFEMENAQELLHVSSLLQLNDLTEICFKHLEKSLTVYNCFTIQGYAQTFSHEAVTHAAECFVLKNFEKVIATKGFVDLSISSISTLMLRSAELPSTVQWLAIATWIKDDVAQRKKHLFKLAKHVNFSTYPFDDLLKNVWNDTLIQESDNTKQLLIAGLSSDMKRLESNISCKNCFALKEILKNTTTLSFIYEFIVGHFPEICEMDEFNSMSEEDMLAVHAKVKSHSLEKWRAALRWVKHSLRNRRNTFPKLLKTINLDHFSVNFIENTIRREPLVQESHECKDLIISVLCRKINDSKTNHSGDLEVIPKPTTHAASYILLLDKKTRNIRGFEPTTQSWTTIASAEHISNTGYAAIAWVKQTLYLLYNKTLYSLNADHRWMELSDMSFKPDKTTKMVSFDGAVYVVSTTFMAFYNPSRSEWMHYRQPNNFEGGFCLAATEKNLYAFGGYPCSDRSQKYDPGRIAWSGITPMRHERGMAAATTHKGFIFVLGGRKNELSLLRSVERYDPSSDSWTEIQSMSLPRCNFCSCNLNGKLFAIGGQDSIEEYDDDKQRWSQVGTINSRPFGISACVYTCWKVRTVRDGKITDTIVPM